MFATRGRTPVEFDSLYQVFTWSMDFETFILFQSSNDSDFHIEVINVKIFLSDYQNLYFDHRMAFARFDVFVNTDVLSYEVSNIKCDYYNSFEFHNLLENMCDCNLRILPLNIRNTPKNLLRLETEYASILHSFDILCISETYLTE